MELVPPPPYSETDIYSNAPASPHILTPTTSQADDSSQGRRLHSTASSVENAILTPTASVGDELDIASSTSAAAYFDSRPAPGSFTGQSTVYRISVTLTTEPQDLRYPEEWRAKGITEQDWATFVNYLLPDHAVGINNDVAERKLRAEMPDEQLDRLSIGREIKSRDGMTEIDAQLGQLRRPPSSRTVERANRIEATISEWNDGFFEPRGIHIAIVNLDIEMAAGDERRPMPGSFIPYGHEIGESENRRDQRSFFGRLRSSQGMDSNSRGFRLGSISANNEGFRIGRGLVADNTGFRLGSISANNEGFRIGNGLVADNNGFRLGNMFVANHNGVRFGGSRALEIDGNGISLGRRSLGRGGAGLHDREILHDRHGHRGRSNVHGRHGRHSTRRERSSSTSSSSSSSSSASDASVGSLPDYDDLKDQQLPVAKKFLVEWRNHPEQPITREGVQRMRQDIKEAKRGSSKQLDQDLKVLKREVRELLKQFKEGKKAQKKQKREAKRERRAIKRVQKKDRRIARKEARNGKANGERERCGHRAGRGGRNEPPPWTAHDHTSLFGPSAPPMPTPMHFGRAASDPSIKGPPLGRDPPGMLAIHGGWPFTQNLPYTPGGISAPRSMEHPSPISHGAKQLHVQAQQMEAKAKSLEGKAIELRTAATNPTLGEKEKLRSLEVATTLEEDADRCRMEANRLSAEVLHLDCELARGLEDGNGDERVSGVIS